MRLKAFHFLDEQTRHSRIHIGPQLTHRREPFIQHPRHQYDRVVPAAMRPTNAPIGPLWSMR